MLTLCDSGLRSAQAALLRDTGNQSSLTAMADPHDTRPSSERPKPEPTNKEQPPSSEPTKRKSIARDILDKEAEKAHQAAQGLLDHLGTVDSELDTAPRSSEPYFDDETRELLGLNSNAEEQRIEQAEAQRLADVQRSALRAAAKTLRKREELAAREEALLKAQQERDEAQQRRDTIKLGQKIREMGHEPAQQQYHPINDITNYILRAGLAADPKPDPPVSEPPILAKFWKLTESNFFMGGGLASALAGYGFLLAGAPGFAIALLFLSWLVTTVAVYRHGFFEGKSRRFEILGNVTISATLAIALVVFWVLLVPHTTNSIPSVTTDTNKPAPSAHEQNETEGKEFLSEKYQAIGNTKTFTFLSDKNYGAVSFQGRFGLGPDVTTIVVIHSIDDNPGIVGDCLTAINNYQAIVEDLKTEMKKGRPEFIAIEVYPMLICHYDYSGTNLLPEKSEALKRLALAKHIFLRIEGPNGPQ